MSSGQSKVSCLFSSAAKLSKQDFLVNNHQDTEGFISDSKLRDHVDKVDIDRDGKIDFNDLCTFLKRHNFIENQSNRLVDTVKSAYGFDISNKVNNFVTEANQNLFPVERMDEEKTCMILRELRNTL